jgi:hypothetical protein
MPKETPQDRANARAYDDGARCAKKGLGLKKSGIFDFDAHRRLFNKRYRAFCRGLDRDEAARAWFLGWSDELWRLESLKNGLYPCGRPF